MEPIREGAQGAAVEDIQERLSSLGYPIDEHELSSQTYGPTTARSVAHFRLDKELPLGSDVDGATWTELVDSCYELGDRNLYLRLPNLHGNDVHELQERLNILGFSCGKVDGYYGVHTEAAVKQFQESQGVLADGMVFPETCDAINRLHHVWSGKQAQGPHPMGGMGFARAAGVLERMQLSLTAEDPISRNICGRIWNLASATSEHSGLDLIDNADCPREGDDVVIVLSCSPLPKKSAISNLTVEDTETLPLRIRTTLEGLRDEHLAAGQVTGNMPASESCPWIPRIRLELPSSLSVDGTFTVNDAQGYAVQLLDALCAAFDVQGR